METLQNKELAYRIYKDSYKHIRKRKMIENCKRFKKDFTEEEIDTANEHETQLNQIIREM